MEKGVQYGGVVFLEEIPNPGKSKRRYCTVECSHCGTIFGRILSHVYNGNIESCGCKFKHGPKPAVSAGDILTTTQGYEIEVIEYVNYYDLTVKFCIDGRIVKTDMQVIENKSLKHPYHIHLHGVGYDGELPNTSPAYSEIRKCWRNLLRRLFQKGDEFKSYENTTIEDDWLNFSNFYQWAYAETSGNLTGLDLDKDILSEGSKHYGPDTCCFIPSPMNKMLSRIDYSEGGYYDTFGNRWRIRYNDFETGNAVVLSFKTEDEANQAFIQQKSERYIKIAERFKGQISQRVYDRLIERSKNL